MTIFRKDIIVPTLMASGMILSFWYFSSGPTLLVTFVPGVVVAYIFYFLTVFRKQPDPQKVLPTYLLALGVQFLHFAEELTTGFNHRFPALFDSPEYSVNTFLVFNMSAYFLFILGGIMIYLKVKPPMIVPLFFVVYGTMGNAIAHAVFALMAGGYFPGLYTSFIYWFIGPILIMKIWKATRV